MCMEEEMDGWTDRRKERHDEANSRFSQFSERAHKRGLVAYVRR
jgi:hypothetical protein